MSEHRWQSLEATTATSAVKTIITSKMRRYRSGHVATTRRRDQLELIAPYALPEQPSAERLERKLTSGS